MNCPRMVAPVAVLTVLAFSLAGCAGSSASEAGAANGANGRGPITYVQCKDDGNVVRPLIAAWNEAHPDQEATFKEQSDQADPQHDDLVQNFQAKNADCAVMSADVVWTAEFVANGWLKPPKGTTAIDTVAIASFAGSQPHQEPYTAVMAAGAIVTIPLVIMVLVFQRRIVAGVTAGAVK